MRHQYFRIVLLCVTAFKLTFAVDSSLNETEQSTSALPKQATSIEEHHEYNSRSFTYRYVFDDGSIVSETGDFKFVDNSLTGFGTGYFRFPIRRKIFEFIYDIDEGGVRGVLTSPSENGTLIRERFNQILNGSWFDLHDYSPQGSVHPVHTYEFQANEFLSVDLNLRFPPSEHHPFISCQFSVRSTIDYSKFECKTFENRTERVVDSTINIADPKWLEEFRRSLIETLSFENYHDGEGGYRLKYVFSTGASIDEFGKLADNNSILAVSGYVRFNISERFHELSYMYTANKTDYNILMNFPDKNGTYDQSQIHIDSLSIRESNPIESELRLYSFGDDNGNTVLTRRELIYVDGKPFVRAIYILQLRNHIQSYVINFDINEIHSFGEYVSPFKLKRISKTALYSMVG